MFNLLAALRFAILLTPLSVFGAELNSSWVSLASIAKVGHKLEITRTNSATSQGKLVSVGDQSITIQQRDGIKTIPREEVFRVRELRGGHPVLLGTLIGAAIGAVSLWAVDRGTSDKPRAGESVGLGIFLGAAPGAIGGAWLPNGVILFQAPVRPKPPAH